MPSAPQNCACASGRSIETFTTAVLSRPAASSLNLRTLAWHTPVLMLGKMLRTTRLPATSASVSGSKVAPTRSKCGAWEPTSGSSPTVLTVLSPNCVVAMGTLYRTRLAGMSAARRSTQRTDTIVETLRDAFAPMMRSDPVAFRGKYRKMAADPHAFYRGTACLFAHDVTSADDPFARDGADRIWIHGDLHVENFGTYLNSRGRMIFDINDFDEAYLGHFTWDLQRFVASLALVGWQKALPEESVRSLIGRFVRSYLAQVDHYATIDTDDDFAITLDNAEGPVLSALVAARMHRRSELLDTMTVIRDGARKFVEDSTASRLSRTSRKKVVDAFRGYLDTIPESKRFDHSLFYKLRDVCAKRGFGIGSAGLPAYNVLDEGYTQALENDVVLSMKRANVPALNRFLDSS